MSIATKCTCGNSITGICTSSITECRNFIKKMDKTPNDKLPEDFKMPSEVFEIMSKEAYDYYNRKLALNLRPCYSHVQTDYIAGATAWAGWKVKYDEVKADYDLLASDFNKLLQQKNALATVLQEFVSNHEAGLLPDRFVYDKAIKILNDGK